MLVLPYIILQWISLYIAGDLVIPNFFQINNINFSANYKPDPTGYER